MFTWTIDPSGVAGGSTLMRTYPLQLTLIMPYKLSIFWQNSSSEELQLAQFPVNLNPNSFKFSGSTKNVPQNTCGRTDARRLRTQFTPRRYNAHSDNTMYYPRHHIISRIIVHI
jgi:hypothetical protein